MSIDPDHLAIVNYPHPVLRHKARRIDSITDDVIAVANRMVKLMHEARGVGLAAPQVGLDWRMFVANPTGQEGPDDRIYINPSLSAASQQTERMEEGCLSLPDIRGSITRPLAITISATNLDGQPFTETDDHLLARIWQHEYDHLDGVLILDKMTPQDLRINKRAIAALEGKS